MSLSSAISNALSGLTATTRGTELVSTNISNKSVAGYARRELDLSSRVYSGNGGGVSLDGVRRTVSAGLLADSRLAQAGAAKLGTIATFHATIENAFGTGDSAGSLSGRVAALDAALTSAAARPDNDIRLAGIADAATALADTINGISQEIENARTDAEKAISSDVIRLNTALERIANLNRQITVFSARGEDASSLIDARQASIDELAGIVPIQEVARENGRVALFTKGGITLLDGQVPARIQYDAVTPVTADMSLANGDLASISINGMALNQAEMAMLAGGTLSANFEIRDNLAPEYQRQIDAAAHELYSRFADPAVDPTLAAGQAGLFTDNQAAFLPSNEIGLASRLAVTRLIDPSQGGALSRLRAGLGAAGAGDQGDATVIGNMRNALAASRPPASSSVSATARTMLSFTSELASRAASQRIRSDASLQQGRTHAESVKTALLAQGVDTDTEMEALLSLERSYAANAKVLQTVNDMLDQILRLT